MPSWPLVTYVLMAALRDRLIVSLAILVIVGSSIAVFIGSSAVVEKALFAAVFTAAGLRFAGVAGLVLFVVFYLRRAFDTKDVEFLLARPLSRTGFLLSHAAAFSVLAVFMAGAVVLAVAVLLPEGAGSGALLLWGASLAAEFVIMANAALFFSMVLSSAVGGVMAAGALYVLARLMGEILGILDTAQELPFYSLLSTVMKAVSLIVPRLDLMGQTSWLLYGAGGGIGLSFVLAQGVIYTAFLVCAALVDLTRRQF